VHCDLGERKQIKIGPRINAKNANQKSDLV
jgi:hypothetical protein